MVISARVWAARLCAGWNFRAASVAPRTPSRRQKKSRTGRARNLLEALNFWFFSFKRKEQERNSYFISLFPQDSSLHVTPNTVSVQIPTLDRSIRNRSWKYQAHQLLNPFCTLKKQGHFSWSPGKHSNWSLQQRSTRQKQCNQNRKYAKAHRRPICWLLISTY